MSSTSIEWLTALGGDRHNFGGQNANLDFTDGQSSMRTRRCRYLPARFPAADAGSASFVRMPPSEPGADHVAVHEQRESAAALLRSLGLSSSGWRANTLTRLIQRDRTISTWWRRCSRVRARARYDIVAETYPGEGGSGCLSLYS